MGELPRLNASLSMVTFIFVPSPVCTEDIDLLSRTTIPFYCQQGASISSAEPLFFCRCVYCCCGYEKKKSFAAPSLSPATLCCPASLLQPYLNEKKIPYSLCSLPSSCAFHFNLISCYEKRILGCYFPFVLWQYQAKLSPALYPPTPLSLSFSLLIAYLSTLKEKHL